MNNTQLNPGKKEREAHVLDGIKISKNNTNWSSQILQWNASLSLDERFGWMEFNRIREGNGPERFIFFLNLADRHGDQNLFSSTPDCEEHVFCSEGYISIAQQKSLIAKKAFAILCNFFFDEEQKSYPITLPYQEPLFSTILWFFRPYGGAGGWDNLRPYNDEGLGKDGGKHYLAVARKFARDAALDAWQMLNGYWYKAWDSDIPDPKVAEPHWHEIVTLVRHLGMLDMIEAGQYIPKRPVFMKMLRMVLEENKVAFNESDILLGPPAVKLLEPLVKEGDVLARVLYIAWLNLKN